MNIPVTPASIPTPVPTSMQPAGPAQSPLPGVNVLIEGPAGTGKTYSIGTLVDTGIEVFYFAYEAGTESLLGYWTDRGKPIPPNLHVSTVRAAQASFTDMAEAARQVNTLSYDTLKKSTDPHRSRYNQFEQFLRSFNDVTEDVSGKRFGAVDKWGTDRVVVIDGLTGLGDSVIKSVIGGKADRDQKDWGLAQNMLENLLRQLTAGCRCHFVLIAHVERETDMVLGGIKITVSTLGKALPPKIPPMFSDVLLSSRLGREFFWDTENPMAEVKSRNLPINAKNTPDFKIILDKWKSRGGLLEKTS